MYFKATGKKRWKHITSDTIDSQGRFKKRVAITRSGKWRVRIKGSDKLLPAKSRAYKVRAK